MSWSAQLYQQRRGCHVEVGSALPGTIRILHHAADVPCVARGQLRRPAALSGLRIDCDDRIAVSIGRGRVILAAAEIKQAALGIVGWAVPHWRPRGPQDVRAAARLPASRGSRHRNVRHRSAPVAGSSATTFPRNVQQAYSGSAADVTSSDETGTNSMPAASLACRYGRVRVVVDLSLPELRAVHRVHRISAAQYVPEVEALRRGVDNDCRPHLGGDARAPAQASACKVEGIERAIVAADEDRAPADRRLRSGADRSRVSECPFHFQLVTSCAERPATEAGMNLRLSRPQPTAAGGWPPASSGELHCFGGAGGW